MLKSRSVQHCNVLNISSAFSQQFPIVIVVCYMRKLVDHLSLGEVLSKKAFKAKQV